MGLFPNNNMMQTSYLHIATLANQTTGYVFSFPFLSNPIRAEALCSGVRLDIFLLLPFCFLSLSLSMGVGREASKAQRVSRVRPQDALFYGVFFYVCSFVLLFLSGRPVVGYQDPSVELGKL